MCHQDSDTYAVICKQFVHNNKKIPAFYLKEVYAACNAV